MAEVFLVCPGVLAYRLFAMRRRCLRTTGDFFFSSHKRMPQTSSFLSPFTKPHIWPSVWRRHPTAGCEGQERRHG